MSVVRLPVALTAAVLVVVVTASLVLAQPRPATPPPDEPIVVLPPVVVTAPGRLPETPLPRSSVPATIDVIVEDEIRRSGAINAQDLLNRLRGVTVQDQQGNAHQPDVTIRGFPASPVTGLPQGVSVFVDGVRVNEADVEQVNFDLLPLDDIERIEVIRGPSAIFGRNTLGAAINIITRRGGPRFEIEPEVSVGSFERQKYRLRASGSQGPLDVLVSGTFAHEEGWRKHAASRIGRAFGKIGFRSDGTDVTLSYQHADNDIQQAGSLPERMLREGSRTQNFTGGDFFAPRLHFGTLTARRELGNSTALSANAFARYLRVEQFNSNAAGQNSRSFSDILSAGSTVQVTYDAPLFGRANRVVAGVDVVRNEARNTVFLEHNADSNTDCRDDAVAAGADPDAACPARQMSTRITDVQHAFGVFVQDTFEVAKGLFTAGDALVLTAAVRWDWLRHDITDTSPPGLANSATGVSTFHRVNPRFGVNYNLTADTGIFFSYGEGFRAPAFLELTCASASAACPGLQAGVAPDPPLNAVKARSFEAGVRAKPLMWLETDVAVFRTDVRDDIFSVALSGTGVFFQNVGSTRRQGIETSVRAARRGLGGVHVDYTYTEATFETDAVLATPRLIDGCAAPPCPLAVRRGSSIPLIPNHRLGAGIDYQVTGWLVASLGMGYVGPQYLRGDEPNEHAPLPGYITTTAGLKAAWKDLTAFLTINNLLNREYETFGTFAPNARQPGAPVERFLTPAAPINFVAGVAYRF